MALLPRPVRAVVFDMDGLLIDTEVVYRDAMFAAAARRGHDMPNDLFLRMVGLPGWSSRKLVAEHFGEGFDVEAFLAAATQGFYASAASGALCLKAGVRELLDHLDLLVLPRAIATSSRHESVEHSLGPHEVRHRFHAVIAQGDYERGKPHPDPFLAAARALGVDPADCLALEDSHNGVRAAHAAGMMTVMVPDLLDPTEEMRGLCVRIARDLHEVRGLLSGAAEPHR